MLSPLTKIFCSLAKAADNKCLRLESKIDFNEKVGKKIFDQLSGNFDRAKDLL